MDALPDPPPTPPPPATPLGLDYFAAQAPDRRRSRAAAVWTFCLFLGWVPYLCGVVNVMVAAQSYSAAVVASHASGAALFMATGIVLSVAALAGFVRLRQWTAVAVAALLVAAQVSIAACLAVSNF